MEHVPFVQPGGALAPATISAEADVPAPLQLPTPTRELPRPFASEAMAQSPAAPLVSQLRVVAAMESHLPPGAYLWESIYPQSASTRRRAGRVAGRRD